MHISFLPKSHSKEAAPQLQGLPHLVKWLSGGEAVPQGHIGIFGASGTGKSTLAEMLAKELPDTRILFTSGPLPGWREFGLRGTFTDSTGRSETAVHLNDVLCDRSEGKLNITLPHVPSDARACAAFLGQALGRALAAPPASCRRVWLIFDEVLSAFDAVAIESLLATARACTAQVIGLEYPFSRYQNLLQLSCRWSGKLERPNSLIVSDNFAGETRHYSPMERSA